MHDLTAGMCGRVVAEQVVQQVLLDLWQRPSGFDPDQGSLRSFLLGRTHARAVDMARADRRSAPSAWYPDTDCRHDGGPVGTSTGVEAQAARVLSGLADDQHRAIHLAYLRGYSYPEISLVLGQPAPRVTNLIRTGLMALGAGSITEAVGSDRR